ncbi:MAG: hypothetical protein OQJ97_02005 [Rhodospirillales bacterium]|nr:hypothetical protein [Rhodospirillales bacterium]
MSQLNFLEQVSTTFTSSSSTPEIVLGIATLVFFIGLGIYYNMEDDEPFC